MSRIRDEYEATIALHISGLSDDEINDLYIEAARVSELTGTAYLASPTVRAAIKRERERRAKLTALAGGKA